MEPSSRAHRAHLPAGAADVCRLVRQLVTGLPEDLESGGAAPVRVALPEAPGDVILDVEVDGVRCLLLRPPTPPPPALPDEVRITLSPREQEIARMVARGHPNKTIARVLEISCWTVGTHLRRIFAKLGVGSRAAMVAKLLEEGISFESPPRRPHDAPLPPPLTTPHERPSRREPLQRRAECLT